MPKQTVKYRAATAIASDHLGEKIPPTQEALYTLLERNNFYWNSKTQTWELNETDALPPTDLIRVRVWTDSSSIKTVVRELRVAYENAGFELIEISEPYKCRPPRQLESRVYLSFKKLKNKH